MPFLHAPVADFDVLLGMWAYSRKTWLRWWTTMSHYPATLDIVFSGPFNLVPANPNVSTAGYKGSLKWSQF